VGIEPTRCGATTEQLPLDDGMELKYWNRQWNSKYEFVYRADSLGHCHEIPKKLCLRAIWFDKDLKKCIIIIIYFFITRSGRPALASVPDTINCRILISEYVHVYIISSRCWHHRGPTAAISIFPWNGDITQGGHPSKYWLSRCCCSSVLEIEATGVSTSLGRWFWNLVCFVWSDNLLRTLMWYE
jgi:hypothetical protein